MENDLLDCLEELQYSGACREAGALSAAVSEGPQSAEFRRLVCWLTDQLVTLCGLEETVPADLDADEFQMELSGVLRELHCPHAVLLDGPTQQRLASRPARLLLLDFLCGELQAARMLAVDGPAVGGTAAPAETATAAALKKTLLALNFPKPPAQITAGQLFAKVAQKLEATARAAPADLLCKPLWTGELSADQWRRLEAALTELHHEYRLRREMLLKRLDVTVQSFRWSPRAQQRQEQVLAAFGSRRAALSREPAVRLAHLLAARTDLAVEERTCSSQVRRNTRTGLNRVVIGPVPDRGGRPSEQRAPPPEMPSWKAREAGPPQGGGGGGYRGGGRGGAGDGRGGSRAGGEFRGGRGRGRGGRVQGAGWTRGGGRGYQGGRG
ncbi:protein FAM98A-like isoform X2 [Amphibalanus amphitrite]|uniref:protein FAM98A-like isoform X2 n=1 Tax=Amphibalanus amphitrite TaxID=1232801 RepID=UPI001C92071B|nr:protein FAM98A-like isoform X2 [Amphibalanus amphitrite]